MKRAPAVTIMIVINFIVFFLWHMTETKDFLSVHFLVSYDRVMGGLCWTLVTSAFSHNMFVHFVINMFVLHSFGTFLEYYLGTWRFLKFYFVAGIFGSLCHCLTSAFFIGEPGTPALGASGALAGVILVFSLLFPKEKILIMGIIPVPALFGALGFIGIDLWGLYEQSTGGGLPIGHGAHLGGAFTGILAYFLFFRSPRLRGSI